MTPLHSNEVRPLLRHGKGASNLVGFDGRKPDASILTQDLVSLATLNRNQRCYPHTRPKLVAGKNRREDQRAVL